MAGQDSIWLLTLPEAEPLPPLIGELSVDVAIVGAGITGLTCAYLLARSGVRVAVLERERVAHGESGRTTAHLTEVLDRRFVDIQKDFGEESARRVAAAGRAAIDFVTRVSAEEGIECDLERLPAYLY